ncbi:MAG: hypothetical protein WA723_11440, partial [Pseudolabrys sp.]
GEVRKNTCRYFGDDMVIFARHNWFARFPFSRRSFDRRGKFLDMRNGGAKRDCWQASSGSDLSVFAAVRSDSPVDRENHNG